eukprot:gene15012-16561_t
MVVSALLFAFLLSQALAFRPRPDADRNLFQGDMRLTPVQRMLVESGRDVSLAGKFENMFGSTKHQSLLWSNKIVPYKISPDLAAIPQARFAIYQGFREWESYGCMKFVERTTETDYIYLFNNCSGCWSYVGRQGGKQEVCLDYGCHSRATVAHELAHAMGFWHEQSRPDRDKYIRVVWENIDPDNAYSFDKQKNSDVNSLKTPYDYYSMMQYDETSFSMNGNITMQAKNPGVIQLGNEVGFTKIDSTQAMLLYKCNGKTTKTPFVEPTVVLTGADDCTFDSDMCHFTQAQGDDFDWTLRKGATYSWGTGPSVDHTTSRLGAFAYIEASSPRVEGDEARLVSKLLQGKKCMTIHYHMYANEQDSMGALNIYVKDGTTGLEMKIFSKSGSQGSGWIKKSLDLSGSDASAKYTVIFEGIRGKTYQGDIALDDISFVDGSCGPQSTIAPATVPCADTTDREGQYCSEWKQAGFCESYRIDMKHICRKTCQFCKLFWLNAS